MTFIKETARFELKIATSKNHISEVATIDYNRLSSTQIINYALRLRRSNPPRPNNASVAGSGVITKLST